MPTHIAGPTRIPATGDPPKQIEEFIGRVNSRTDAMSIARMVSPRAGKSLRRRLPSTNTRLCCVAYFALSMTAESWTLRAGEAVVTQAGERVRYSTPGEGAEYLAVCVPAFSPDIVNRD
jgi:hypothetical protein